MANVSAVIVDTPVEVLDPRNLNLSSGSEAILLDSVALPLLMHQDADMLISIQLVRDRSDIQYRLRDLHPVATYPRMHNGISDHILA